MLFKERVSYPYLTFHFIKFSQVLLLLAVLVYFINVARLLVLYCDINVELTCVILILECSMSILYYHMVTCVCQYNVIEMLYLDMTI